MKKILLVGALIAGAVVFNANSQCKKELNNQSKSAVFTKGKVYEMSFIAYSDYNYRISVCTDIIEGGDKLTFTLEQDAIVRVKDANGNTNIKRQREVIYNNSEDNNKQFVKFKTEKTQKMYLKVNVPATGESGDKKLNQTEQVCVGVLLEHRKASKTGF